MNWSQLKLRLAKPVWAKLSRLPRKPSRYRSSKAPLAYHPQKHAPASLVTHLEVPVSTEMLGRVMNSFGEPIDGHPRFFTEEKRDVNGYPLNPTAREYPKRLHPNRHIRHRRLNQPRPWTETASFQRSRSYHIMNLPPKLCGKPRFAAQTNPSTSSSSPWA